MRHRVGLDAALVMAMLRRGVPITLLLDLADPAGPQSEDLLHQEAVGGLAYAPTG